MTSPTLAGKAIVTAWNAKYPGVAVPVQGLTFALMQVIGEGSFTDAFKGTNNWGSYHATAAFARAHANDRGYGMVAFCDGGPYGKYITRMRCLPSQALGARSYLDLVANFTNVTNATTVEAWATDMYVNGYFTGTVKGGTPLRDRAKADASGMLNGADQASIAAYVGMMSHARTTAVAGMAGAFTEPGDPTAITIGPPFASLGFRLTPSPALAPHTIEHAQEVIGKAWSDPPPAAISFQDCMNAPNGEGVWLFGTSPVPTSANPPTASTTGHPVLRGLAIAGALVAAGAAGAHYIDHPPRRLSHG